MDRKCGGKEKESRKKKGGKGEEIVKEKGKGKSDKVQGGKIYLCPSK